MAELAAVVVIIALLAAFSVPRMRKTAEQSKAAEAFGYLSLVRAAQQQYHAREGTYTGALSALDLQEPAPEGFTVGAVVPGNTGSLKDSWVLTFTREDAAAGYGAYTVTFTQDGYDEARSTIHQVPEIDPMVGTEAAAP